MGREEGEKGRRWEGEHKTSEPKKMNVEHRTLNVQHRTIKTFKPRKAEDRGLKVGRGEGGKVRVKAEPGMGGRGAQNL